MATRPRLPLEILLCIIEETALSSRHTLHNLALLSHGTLPFCRKYLFNQLTLEGEEIRSIAIEDFFNRKPCVADYVQRLVLFNPNLAEPACSAYVAILSKFQNVHEFLFTSCVWTSIPDHLESSILNIIQNSSVRSVHLNSIQQVPLDLFFSSASTNLTSLQLGFVSFQARNLVASVTEMSVEDSIPCLQSLVVQSDISRGFVTLLNAKRPSGNHFVNLSHLQQCVLHWYLPGDIAATIELMKIARQIEHLRLDVSQNRALEGLSDMLAHGSVHTLKFLGLLFSFPPLESLQGLYRISPANVLEVFDIEYIVKRNVSWEGIDSAAFFDVFTRPRFPQLRLLALTFYVPRGEYPNRNGLVFRLEQLNLRPFKDACAAVGIEFRFTIQ